VHEHNTVLPHSAFRGQTPDEMYFYEAACQVTPTYRWSVFFFSTHGHSWRTVQRAGEPPTAFCVSSSVFPRRARWIPLLCALYRWHRSGAGARDDSREEQRSLRHGSHTRPDTSARLLLQLDDPRSNPTQSPAAFQPPLGCASDACESSPADSRCRLATSRTAGEPTAGPTRRSRSSFRVGAQSPVPSSEGRRRAGRRTGTPARRLGRATIGHTGGHFASPGR